jgi:polysaccharide biosynthesis/export protein
MKKMTRVLFCFLAIMAGFSIWAAPTAISQTVAGAEYTIEPEDVLNVSVYGQPDLSSKIRVTSQGEINFPLLGNVKVTGLTISQLEKRLAELLEKDYLVNPQVTVFIDEYHPKQVFVLGSVAKPGAYNLSKEKQTTVLEAIAMAGGFSKEADHDGTKVIRVENGRKITIKIKVSDITKRGDKEKDLPLKPNDMIVVPESFF